MCRYHTNHRSAVETEIDSRKNPFSWGCFLRYDPQATIHKLAEARSLAAVKAPSSITWMVQFKRATHETSRFLRLPSSALVYAVTEHEASYLLTLVLCYHVPLPGPPPHHGHSRTDARCELGICIMSITCCPACQRRSPTSCMASSLSRAPGSSLSPVPGLLRSALPPFSRFFT